MEHGGYWGSCQSLYKSLVKYYLSLGRPIVTIEGEKEENIPASTRVTS